MARRSAATRRSSSRRRFGRFVSESNRARVSASSFSRIFDASNIPKAHPTKVILAQMPVAISIVAAGDDEIAPYHGESAASARAIRYAEANAKANPVGQYKRRCRAGTRQIMQREASAASAANARDIVATRMPKLPVPKARKTSKKADIIAA